MAWLMSGIRTSLRRTSKVAPTGASGGGKVRGSRARAEAGALVEPSVQRGISGPGYATRPGFVDRRYTRSGVGRGRAGAKDMYDETALGGGYSGFMLGEGRGLSPIVDVLRGLGNESAGIFARTPRKLGDSELSALGQDGIGRRVVTIKVEQALAPGYAIDMTGMDPAVAQEVVREATKVFRRIKGAEHIRMGGVRAQWYGKAMIASTFMADNGLADLPRALSDVAYAGGGGIRWVSEWDRRDYRTRELASSTSIHYRQGEGATWIDLYPLHGALEYDRTYGGAGRRGRDPTVVPVHPSRYCQLTTVTGFSVFQECAVYIANLLGASAGSASLMQRAAAGVMTMEDWETQSLAGADEARQKLQAQYEALSHMNLMLLAKGETFDWADLSTSGIEGGLYAIAYLLSAATGIPMTILLGTSPGAFVSGDQQIKQWHQELDQTRAWLEPMIRFVWDQCIAEVTGGYVGDYAITWNAYETPSADEALKTQGAALDLALKALQANLLSRDAVLAGLSKTGALGFDFGVALAAAANGSPTEAGTGTAALDPSLFTQILGALTTYYGSKGIPADALSMLIGLVAPSTAANIGTLVQPPAVVPVAAVATGVPGAVAGGAPEDAPLSDVAFNGAQITGLIETAINPALTVDAKMAIIESAFPSVAATRVSRIANGAIPGAGAEGLTGAGGLPVGAPIAGGGGGDGGGGESADASLVPTPPPVPKAPGEPLAPEDIAAENWDPANDVGELFALSSASLRSLRTAVPGVVPAPGEIAWLQNPASGHARYRRSDLAKAMIGGRALRKGALGERSGEGAVGVEAADLRPDRLGKRLSGEGIDWPTGGIAWTMERVSDETGVSGTGVVVRGLALSGGDVLSWWVVEGMPARPHVDACWWDFYVVHIQQHPSNGTRIMQQAVDGNWVPVTDLARGPGPWVLGSSTPHVDGVSGSDNRIGALGLKVGVRMGGK